MAKKNLPILIMVFFTLTVSSCTSIYFNTFHNIRKNFNTAEKSRNKDARDNAKGAEVKQYNDAIAKSSKVLERHPTSGYVDDALYIIGASYYYLGDYDKSARKFKELFANYPETEYASRSRILLAKAKLHLKEEAEAVVIFEEIFEQETAKSMKADAARALGEYYFEAKDYDNANIYFASLIDSLGEQSDKLRALMFVASGYYEGYRFGKARDNYEEALNYDPDTLQYFQIVYRLAECDYFLNDLMGGLERLETLSENEIYYDSLAPIRLKIAEGYEWDGDFDAAINTYDKLIIENPGEDAAAVAYYNLGLIYQYDFEELGTALEYYQKAREERRNSSIMQDATRRASKLAMLERYVKSGEVGMKADSTGELDQDMLDQLTENQYLLGELFYFDLEKPDSAVHAYRTILDRYPESRFAPGALISMAYIYRNDYADTAGADSLLRKVLESYAKSDEAEDVIGMLGLSGTIADTGYASLTFVRADGFLEQFLALDSSRYQLSLVADSLLTADSTRRADSVAILDSLMASDTLQVPDSLAGPDGMEVEDIVLDSEAPPVDSTEIFRNMSTADSLRVADSIKYAEARRVADSIQLAFTLRHSDSARTADSIRVADSVKAMDLIRMADSLRGTDPRKPAEKKVVVDPEPTPDAVADEGTPIPLDGLPEVDAITVLDSLAVPDSATVGDTLIPPQAVPTGDTTAILDSIPRDDSLTVTDTMQTIDTSAAVDAAPEQDSVQTSDSVQVADSLAIPDTATVEDTLMPPQTIPSGDTTAILDSIPRDDSLTVTDTMQTIDTSAAADAAPEQDSVQTSDSVQVADSLAIPDTATVEDTLLPPQTIPSGDTTAILDSIPRDDSLTVADTMQTIDTSAADDAASEPDSVQASDSVQVADSLEAEVEEIKIDYWQIGFDSARTKYEPRMFDLLDSAQYYYHMVIETFPLSKYSIQSRYVLLWMYDKYLAPGDSAMIDLYKSFVDSFPGTEYAQFIADEYNIRSAGVQPKKRLDEMLQQEEGQGEEEADTSQFATFDAPEETDAPSRSSQESKFITGENGEQLEWANEYFLREELPFEYPWDAIALRIEDKLYFQIRINPYGEVIEAKLMNKTESTDLNQRILETVKRSKFDHARINPELYDGWFYYTREVRIPADKRQ